LNRKEEIAVVYEIAHGFHATCLERMEDVNATPVLALAFMMYMVTKTLNAAESHDPGTFEQVMVLVSKLMAKEAI
jgi:hypothetical protein